MNHWIAADFWLAVSRRHSGPIRATAIHLALSSMLNGLRGSDSDADLRPGSFRVAAAPGGLGRYEARKSDLQNTGRSAAWYSRRCRAAARDARV